MLILVKVIVLELKYLTSSTNISSTYLLITYLIATKQTYEYFLSDCINSYSILSWILDLISSMNWNVLFSSKFKYDILKVPPRAFLSCFDFCLITSFIFNLSFILSFNFLL